MPSSLHWVQHEPCVTFTKGTTSRPFFARRSHRKSRDGCLICKSRRIKCDEERPSCGQCQFGRRTCKYAQSASNTCPFPSNIDTEGIKSKDVRNPETFPAQVSSMALFGNSIDTLAAAQGWQKVAPRKTYVELLAFFRYNTVSTLSSPTWQQIITSKGLHLIQRYPLYLHSILAFTASHLSSIGGRSDFTIAARFHTQQALELYSRRLQKIHDRIEMDAILAVCFMLTALFYLSNDALNTTGSWMNNSQNRINKPHWSSILSGPSLLLQSQSHINSAAGSLWMPFTRNSQYAISQAMLESGPGESLVALLHDICSRSFRAVNATSNSQFGETTSTINSYLPALASISPSLKIHFDPNTSKITPCTDVATYVLLMTFPSRLDHVFLELLRHQDPVALLLVGFWFALLAKLQHCQWWSLRRALSEGYTVLSFLVVAEINDAKMRTAVWVLNQIYDDELQMPLGLDG